MGMMRVMESEDFIEVAQTDHACATCNNAADAYACSCARSYRRHFRLPPKHNLQAWL